MVQKNQQINQTRVNNRSASTRRKGLKGLLSLNSKDDNLSLQLDYVDQGLIYNALKVDTPVTVKNKQDFMDAIRSDPQNGQNSASVRK